MMTIARAMVIIYLYIITLLYQHLFAIDYI